MNLDFWKTYLQHFMEIKHGGWFVCHEPRRIIGSGCSLQVQHHAKVTKPHLALRFHPVSREQFIYIASASGRMETYRHRIL